MQLLKEYISYIRSIQLHTFPVPSTCPGPSWTSAHSSVSTSSVAMISYYPVKKFFFVIFKLPILMVPNNYLFSKSMTLYDQFQCQKYDLYSADKIILSLFSTYDWLHASKLGLFPKKINWCDTLLFKNLFVDIGCEFIGWYRLWILCGSSATVESRARVPKVLGSNPPNCHLHLRSSLGKGIWPHTYPLLPEKPQAYIMASPPSMVAEYLKKMSFFIGCLHSIWELKN